MKCNRSGFSPSEIDFFRILDLPDDYSERKRWQSNPEHRATLEYYAWFMEQYQEARVADLGSGPGTVAVPLARLRNVASIRCFEQDPRVRQALRDIKEAGKLSKIEVDGEGQPWDLHLAADAIDVAICRFSMHHFDDQPGTVREIGRCLRPGGLLLYSDPAMPEYVRDATHGLYQVREDTFRGYRTYQEMMDLLTGAGFTPAAIRPYDYQHSTLADYLSETPEYLRDALIRAWLELDLKTKRELKWSGEVQGPFITYPIIDIAAHIPNPA